MECAELMKKLEIPLPGQQAVMQYKMESEEYQEWRQLFYTDTGEFFTRSRKREDKESLYLFLYLSFATELYDRYVRLNITDRIYYDTFSDIRIWYEHCVRERGVPGLVEEEWFTRHLNMRLFRLGRLQFETEGGCASCPYT